MAEQYYLIKGSTLTAIADVLRDVDGEEEYNPSDMPNAIKTACNIAYSNGYTNGANSELDALYDFHIIATPTGCEFWVVNYHPTYFLTITVCITNNLNNSSYTESFSVDPDGGDYYWSYDSGNVMVSSSGNEWEINVEGVEWTK